jgi:predicted nucleotidyltransferase
MALPSVLRKEILGIAASRIARNVRAFGSAARGEADDASDIYQRGHIMERVDLPLSELSLAQKLDLMEAIWDDLTKHEKILESPYWHEPILKDREEALSAGKATVSNWEEAKDRIRRNTTCE